MIAIDPGVNFCGVACFDIDGELRWARYVATDEVSEFCDLSNDLVIEMPRIYSRSGQRKGDLDLNDLLNLAAAVGYCEGFFYSSKRVFPAQWKGQVPKKIMNARVLSKLSPAEQGRVQNVGSKTHNVIDAVGIGLHALHRLGGK